VDDQGYSEVGLAIQERRKKKIFNGKEELWHELGNLSQYIRDHG
jgi:hypothetical protein